MCGANENYAVETVNYPARIRRRRECICGHRFTTYEKIDTKTMKQSDFRSELKYQDLTLLQILLIKVAEECSETAKVACKAQLHGIDDCYRGQSNRSALEHELADIAAIANLLHIIGEINLVDVERLKQEKIDKLKIILAQNGYTTVGAKTNADSN